jgi:signal transduction histidine kinase
MSPEFYLELWSIITKGEVWRGEFHNRKKNGELYWEWATMTSIKNDKGEITNYIAIKEDISLRKQMEAELIVAKEKAEESDRLKSAFLANMSHEIRTPLNSIIGFSELLTDSAFEIEQKTAFIEHIIINGNNLLNIISDIVDISKIEAGEITIRNSKIQVTQFLDEISALHLINVERKKLQFNLSLDESLAKTECSVLADKERLQQIFNNLISNALKFTSEGYIEIGCRLVDSMVEFHVKDTGIGIPPDYHARIFDRFRQVEASYTRKFGGNGLGLAISKNLIELMGGKIWVESELGKGSTFYFTLPTKT